MDLLAEMLACAPTPEALVILAETKPDKFIFAMCQLARIAGFSERRELTVDVIADLVGLSDSQLIDRLRVLAPDLPALLEAVPLDDAAEPQDAAP